MITHDYLLEFRMEVHQVHYLPQVQDFPEENIFLGTCNIGRTNLLPYCSTDSLCAFNERENAKMTVSHEYLLLG